MITILIVISLALPQYHPNRVKAVEVESPQACEESATKLHRLFAKRKKQVVISCFIFDAEGLRELPKDKV